MSLYSWDKVQTPWYPDASNIQDFWQLRKSIDLFFKCYVNEKEVKKSSKEYVKNISTCPNNSLLSMYNTTAVLTFAYMFYFIGVGKNYVRDSGCPDMYNMNNYDRNITYYDDEWGGRSYQEVFKRWNSPRKAQFFM